MATPKPRTMPTIAIAGNSVTCCSLPSTICVVVPGGRSSRRRGRPAAARAARAVARDDAAHRHPAAPRRHRAVGDRRRRGSTRWAVPTWCHPGSAPRRGPAGPALPPSPCRSERDWASRFSSRRSAHGMPASQCLDCSGPELVGSRHRPPARVLACRSIAPTDVATPVISQTMLDVILSDFGWSPLAGRYRDAITRPGGAGVHNRSHEHRPSTGRHDKELPWPKIALIAMTKTSFGCT